MLKFTGSSDAVLMYLAMSVQRLLICCFIISSFTSHSDVSPSFENNESLCMIAYKIKHYNGLTEDSLCVKDNFAFACGMAKYKSIVIKQRHI